MEYWSTTALQSRYKLIEISLDTARQAQLNPPNHNHTRTNFRILIKPCNYIPVQSASGYGYRHAVHGITGCECHMRSSAKMINNSICELRLQLFKFQQIRPYPFQYSSQSHLHTVALGHRPKHIHGLDTFLTPHQRKCTAVLHHSTTININLASFPGHRRNGLATSTSSNCIRIKRHGNSCSWKQLQFLLAEATVCCRF